MENNYLLAPTIERLFGVYADHPQGSLFISGPKESDLSGVLDYLLNLIYAPHGVQPGRFIIWKNMPLRRFVIS